MMEVEISDEELERRMRRNLFFNGASKRESNSFTDEEKRIADKLLGKSESQRLQNRRDNSRRFKPKPPLVVAEYYERPPSSQSWSSDMGGWTIDVRENGILRNSKTHLSREECLKLCAGLSRKGVQIKPIITEWMKQEGQRTSSAPKPSIGRKSFAERYRNFGKVG